MNVTNWPMQHVGMGDFEPECGVEGCDEGCDESQRVRGWPFVIHAPMCREHVRELAEQHASLGVSPAERHPNLTDGFAYDPESDAFAEGAS